ncbi:MAG: GNAT family N-acetyltransferase [bacterium]|nr:GNAT family N-acetyltransferase [bacterium]
MGDWRFSVLMNVTIRRFTPEDTGFAVAQTHREGWEATVACFHTHLAHDADGCFIAEVNGERAGMVTTTSYAGSGWIGNLIVAPSHRQRGLGERLMVEAMSYLSGNGLETIRLEADPPGVKLYRRLGFVEEFESLRFRLEPRPDSVSMQVDPLKCVDLPNLASFDEACFGDRRLRMVGLLFDRSVAGFRDSAADRIVGYACLVPVRSGLCLGPWLSSDVSVAERLLRSGLSVLKDGALVVGVPAVNGGAVTLLETYGGRRVPSSLRMVRGRSATAGRPEYVFGIGGGAIG